MKENIFKIVFFGEGGVGKKSLANKINTAPSNLRYPNGVSIRIKEMIFNRNQIQINIWIPSALTEFPFWNNMIFHEVDGGFLVFDITHEQSFKKIHEWMERITKSFRDMNLIYPLILMGNKIDLEDKKIISREQALEITEHYNIFKYVECSAKMGENVEDAFEMLIKEILKNEKN